MGKNILINSEITKKYPGIRVAYIVAKNLDVISTPPRQKKINRAAEKLFREKNTLENLEQNKKIASWIELYKKMGVYSSDCLPAQFTLARRILKGNVIPKINNIVDLANLLALKSLLPVGAFDWDNLQGNIELRFSKKSESYIALFEEDETPVPDGEIVYADEIGIFSRYSKDADRTKIIDHTKAVFFVIDGTEVTTNDELVSFQDELISILKDVTDSAVISEKGIASNEGRIHK